MLVVGPWCWHCVLFAFWPVLILDSWTAWHAASPRLAAAKQAAAKKPIIVVTLTAVPLDIAFFKDNAKVGAIVHAGQPSVTVLGLAEVMFKEGGRSPSGACAIFCGILARSFGRARVWICVCTRLRHEALRHGLLRIDISSRNPCVLRINFSARCRQDDPNDLPIFVPG